MKLHIFIFYILLNFNLLAQSKADIFNLSSTEITWCGLDFSKAKFVGSSGFTDPLKIQSYYFANWNSLILIESDKYDLCKTFIKNKINHDITVVEKNNQSVNAAEMVIDKSAEKLTISDLESVVKSYKTKIKDSIGLVFIVESFDKLAERATIHVTFFNTETKEIIFTGIVDGKPFGFGFRNYWAGAISNILKTIQVKKFKVWKLER